MQKYSYKMKRAFYNGIKNANGKSISHDDVIDYINSAFGLCVHIDSIIIID